MAIPYGYIKSGDRWLIDENTAAVIERIFLDFCDPYRRPSLLEMADDLNADEIQGYNGGQWQVSAVRSVLQNDAYAGTRDFPAIVDRELFERAQSRLAALPFGPTR